MEFIQYLATVDGNGIAALLFAAALTGLLFGIAPAWRGLQRGMRDAPVQAVLRRQDAGALTARQVRNAEVRCALCPVKGACEARVRRGEALPADCPNRALVLSPAA